MFTDHAYGDNSDFGTLLAASAKWSYTNIEYFNLAIDAEHQIYFDES